MDEKDENVDVQANLEDLKASLSALQAPEVRVVGHQLTSIIATVYRNE